MRSVVAKRHEDGSSARAVVCETLLGEALAAGTAAAFVCDDDLVYIAANEAGCRLVGYPLDELLDLRASDVVIASEERLRRLAAEVGSRKDVLLGEVLLRRKDGEKVEVSYLSAPTKIGALGLILTLCWNKTTISRGRELRRQTESLGCGRSRAAGAPRV